MKNLLRSLGRRQRADKEEECLLRGSAGENTLLGEESSPSKGEQINVFIHL